MRAVFDTNVLISGLIWFGAPRALIESVRAHKLSLISSPALLAEFADVMARPKFRAVLDRSGVSLGRILAELTQLAEIVDPPSLLNPVSRDAADDNVLAVATAAQADIVISGDADLLVLKRYLTIAILSPADALALIAARDALQ